MNKLGIILITQDNSFINWCRIELASVYNLITIFPGEKQNFIEKEKRFSVVITDCLKNLNFARTIFSDCKEKFKKIFLLVERTHNKKTILHVEKNTDFIFARVENLFGNLRHFIEKLFTSLLKIHAMRRSSDALKEKSETLFTKNFSFEKKHFMDFDIFSGDSIVMKQFRESVELAVSCDETVLITGENGCGKSYTANYIQYNSKRKQKPFVKLNCAHLNSQNAESELFGTEAGAYTNAVKRSGLFSTCHEGTFLFDEIGDIDLEVQKKLLDLIERRVYRKMGSTRETHFDVRFIFATNANLKEKIASGNFRRDLFYRMNILPIKIPSLREHIEDVPFLAESFLKKHNKILTLGAIEKLCSYSYPGNIRQLNNILLRACTFLKSKGSEENLISAEMINFD